MLNILIVDDSLILREKLTTILKDLGHKVIGTAKDGKEAIELAEKLKPDLITIDTVMPIMSGIEAIRKIRENDKKANIIVISAIDREEDILASFREGVLGYIIKPFTADKIKNEISNVLSHCMQKNS